MTFNGSLKHLYKYDGIDAFGKCDGSDAFTKSYVSGPTQESGPAASPVNMRKTSVCLEEGPAGCNAM